MPEDIQHGACRTTASGNHVRLEMPLQAARTVGPPEGADAPLNQSREAHHAARPLHSPEGLMPSEASEPASRRGDEGTGGASRLPQSKHGRRLKALTCTLAPLAGFEPAPYGLEVRHNPSAWCHADASPQVASDLPSAWSHPGRHRDNDRIANGIASRTLARPTSDRTTGLRIGWVPPSGRCGAAGAVDSGQQQLGGD
jgi:hypothetical protein